MHDRNSLRLADTLPAPVPRLRELKLPEHHEAMVYWATVSSWPNNSPGTRPGSQPAPLGGERPRPTQQTALYAGS